MAATLHDVSRLAGVSVKTVSNVINDYPHVRPATRQRVLDAIAELGYTPNLSARSLRSGRSHVISLVIPELRNAYFGELADAVMRAARQRGLSVLIEQFGNDRESELAVLQTAQRQMVDGMIYSVLALEESDRAVIADIRMPVVLLGDRLFDGPRDHVAMQNAEGSRAATEHLIAQGARRIVALGEHRGEVIGSAGLRLRGYREALERAGISYDPDLVLPAGTWHRRDGAEAMRALLERSRDFDGVVAFNDTLAFGAMRVIEEAGLRVPDDVLIIGFDDLDETRYSIPTLSSINPGREEIATVAVDLLCSRIEASEETEPVREIAVPFELVQRESSRGIR